MNIPINYAKWSAPTLPAGLKIKNGIISGTPSGEGGKLIVPVSVATPWGSDTKNITFNLSSAQKYAIYQNGEKLEDITLSGLITSIQNGTAQEKYNCTNTQIMIPILTPAFKNFMYRQYEDEETANGKYVFEKTHIEEKNTSRDSKFDIAAVNFCSFRNVTLADGSVKPGLILQFDKTLWRTFCCFDTGDSARDPDSFTAYCEVDDNINENTLMNRWKYCTLRQWLNSQGSNWFSPAYDTDVLFRVPDSVYEDYGEILDSTFTLLNMRDTQNGFLSLLPQDLVEALQPIKVQTQAFFNEDNFDESIEEPDIIDDVYVDVTYDKIFIPSLEEMNIKPLNESLKNNYGSSGYKNNKRLYANDGIEGTAWEYYINKFGTQSRFESDNTFDGIKDFGLDLVYDFEEYPSQPNNYYMGNRNYEHLRAYPRGHMTRSACLENNMKFWGCRLDNNYGTNDSDPNTILLSVETYDVITQYYSFVQPAPAFVLC